MSAVLEEAFAAYSQGWAGLAADGITPHWHAGDFRFYKAEEMRAVYTAWDDALAYWRMNEALHSAVDLRFGEVQDMGLPGPATLALAKMDWRITFAEDAVDPEGRPFRHAGKAMAGWNHVLSAWEEREGRLGLTGWMEVPDAPPIYLADLYFRMAERDAG